MPRTTLFSLLRNSNPLTLYTRHPSLPFPTHIVIRSRPLSSSTKLRATKPVWPYLYSNNIMAPQLESHFKQVDAIADHFIQRLADAVAIPSVSAEDDRRPDVVRVSHAPNNQRLSVQVHPLLTENKNM
jgi:hypothetical protein